MSDTSKNLTPPPPDGQILIYEDGASRLQVRLDGRTVWLTQRLMAELYQVSVKTINEHLINIYREGELDGEATIRKFRIVQREGSRDVTRSIDHYNLDAILAVGYRVRSARGTAFRKWATTQLRELLVKGFVLDDERLKEGRTLGADYFDELLERIRDIRASERMFYQKITDIPGAVDPSVLSCKRLRRAPSSLRCIDVARATPASRALMARISLAFARMPDRTTAPYATSIDYDPAHPTSQTFFATVQNKLHWAIHGRTAAEIIKERADASRPHMGLTTWKNAPAGPIRKADVTVAKNYLSQDEISELNRVVTMYLDYAEDQARRRKPMHMADWVQRLDAFLEFNERNILTHAGTVSHELAQAHAHAEFEKHETDRRRLEAEQPTSDFDEAVEEVKRLQGRVTPTGQPSPENEKSDE